jgi:hypothetical protein
VHIVRRYACSSSGSGACSAADFGLTGDKTASPTRRGSPSPGSMRCDAFRWIAKIVLSLRIYLNEVECTAYYVVI